MIAAITSCTNTSNPSVMVAAGLLAKKAVERGLADQALGQGEPGPGLQGGHRLSARRRARQSYLDQLRFNLVGYGCTTCIGNSGPLSPEVTEAIHENDLVAVGRALGQPQFRGPHQPRGPGQLPRLAAAGRRLRPGRHHGFRPAKTSRWATIARASPVYLKDIWPSQREIQDTILKSVRSEMFQSKYAEVFAGDDQWNSLPVPQGDLYEWDPKSTYVKNPPYFSDMTVKPAAVAPIAKARVLARAGRQHHDRPHLAGRLDQDGQPGRAIPDRAWSRASRTSTPTDHAGGTTR